MRIALGCDHKGYSVKADISRFLEAEGHSVLECPSHGPEPVDFPDVTLETCRTVTAGRADRAILLCSTGVGAVMAANKVPGIRATLCGDTYSAHQAVEHDDANVLCIGAEVVGILLIREIIGAFLAAEFDTAPEFRRRVGKLNAMDQLV